MDRPICYPGQLLPDTTLLSGWKSVLYALGHFAQAVLGPPTALSGLILAPTSPATLHVTVGVGSLYTLEAVDANAYGSLGTDANQIVKQGILAAPTQLTITPPSTAGYSQVYLVQAIYNNVDGGTALLPYFNSANPQVPFSGPANDGLGQATVRQGALVIALKAGAAAPTGSQVAPGVDLGYTPMYLITVSNGQTQITSANWTVHPSAPFIPLTLPQVPPAIQVQAANWALDTGSANALAIALPSYTVLTAGMPIRIKKGAQANTGAMTLSVNTGASFPVVWEDGTQLVANDWPANAIGCGIYDGTALRVQSPISSSMYSRGVTAYFHWAADTGTANNYVLAAPNPAVTSRVAGNAFGFKAAHTNTGASAVTISAGAGGTSVPILRPDGSALQAGDISSSGLSIIEDDGTNFFLMDAVPVTPVGGSYDLAWTAVQVSANNTSSAYNQTITMTGSTSFTTTLKTPVAVDYAYTLVNASTQSQYVATPANGFYDLDTTLAQGTALNGAAALLYIPPGGIVTVRSDQTNWVTHANYKAADTTNRGLARQATLAEAKAGVTSGSVPAFLTPEDLAAFAGQVDVQTFLTSGTWTKPAGAPNGARVRIQVWGGGQGGCSNVGGQGGWYNEWDCYASDLPSSAPIVIGAGGAGVSGTAGTGGAPWIYNDNTAASTKGWSPGSATTFGSGLFGQSVTAPGGGWDTYDMSTGTAPSTISRAGGYNDAYRQNGPGGLSVVTQTSNTPAHGVNDGWSVTFPGGGGASTGGVGGTSVYGGNGGNAGVAGATPSGGGGASSSGSGTGLAGGNGKVVVTTNWT